MSSAIPFGDPESITCRHCGKVRRVRSAGGRVYRVCFDCDQPTPRPVHMRKGVEMRWL